MKHLASFAALLLSITAFSAAVEPEELLRDAALFGRFETLTARIDMDIHDRGVKSRTFELFVEQNGDFHKAFMHVIAPVFLNRMKFLTIGRVERTDQWISTSRGVRRVAGSARTERLFDSDFVVDDFMPPQAGEYELRELPNERVNGEPARVLEVTPLRGPPDYSRRVVYISTADRILVRAEYYSDSGELVRLFELHERRLVDGVPFPARATMHTLSAGTYTEIVLQEARTGATIPARIFSPGNL